MSKEEVTACVAAIIDGRLANRAHGSDFDRAYESLMLSFVEWIGAPQ